MSVEIVVVDISLGLAIVTLCKNEIGVKTRAPHFLTEPLQLPKTLQHQKHCRKSDPYYWYSKKEWLL